MVLAAVTGFCDSHGGPGAFMAYIMQLVSHGSSGRIGALLELDVFLLRSHMARMSAAGQHFDIAAESEKHMAHFLAQARSRVEAQFCAAPTFQKNASSEWQQL